jgi:hypothetical protein
MFGAYTDPEPADETRLLPSFPDGGSPLYCLRTGADTE